MNAWIRQADTIGNGIFDLARYIRSLGLLVYLSVRSTFFASLLAPKESGLSTFHGFRQVFSVVSAQIYFTGWQAMPLISVLALAAGGVSIMQSSAQLSMLGGTSMLGDVMVMIIVREFAPLITALIVIARSGTAVASEIGNMKVNREIEALQIMGINPLSYIVFPRIAGGVLSVLALAFYFNAIALIGGFLVSRAIHDLPFAFYFESLSNAFSGIDIFLFFIKNGFSGLIIFVLACHQGLSIGFSSHEVPQATTKAVVHSIIAVTGLNVLISIIFYLKEFAGLGIL
jgi:phospholipid/cholesterol/gamma-HCH transport system permease protein